jgi:hypothetical protein
MLLTIRANKKTLMSIAIKTRWLFVAVFVLSLEFCFGQTAPVNFTFSGADTPVWDFTGSFQINQNMQGAGGQDVPLSFSIAITQDPAGQLRGTDWTILGVGNDFVAANYFVSGRVTGGGTAAKVTLLVRLKGEDTIAGVFTPFNLVIKYDLQVVEGALVGKSRGSARFSKLGSATINDANVSLPLAAGMNGSWTLQLSVVALQKLAGSASIVLSNGRTLPATLSGSFASGRSAVKLTGINEATGSRLNVVFFDNAAAPDSMRGRILGQTVQQSPSL